MVRLLLLRHAKALRDGATDAERPLAPEGRKAAASMGHAMKEAGYVPERILCSPSRRTRETLLGVLPELLTGLPENAQITLVPSLYNTGPEAYLAAVRTLGDRAAALLVIGHNPAIQELAGELVGTGSSDLRATLAAKFPTGALAVIDFAAGEWSAVEPGTGRLVDFIEPG
jgi:phosphohistidine phosphatase